MNDERRSIEALRGSTQGPFLCPVATITPMPAKLYSTRHGMPATGKGWALARHTGAPPADRKVCHFTPTNA